MAVGGVGLGILGPFMIDIISSGQEVKAFFAQWTIGIFLVLFGGPMNAWLVGEIGDRIRLQFCPRMALTSSSSLFIRHTEKFPAKIRLTSAAFGYDLSHCTASAFSPLIATLLVQQYGVNAPGFIYPFFAVVSLLGMLLSTDIYRCGGIDEIDDNYDSEYQLADVKENDSTPNQLS